MKLGWLLLLLLLAWRSRVGAFCPPGCTCTRDASPSVDCNGAGLKAFPLFLNPRTRSINLRNNELTKMSHEELEFYRELEFLDLSHNKLVQLDKAPFYPMPKLRVLNLQGNQLSKLNIDTFRGLESLAILDLSDNDIARIPTSVFVDLGLVELLNLSSNVIADMSPGAFTGLNSLLELHLASNELRTIPKVALHAPTSLRVLDLSDNLLSSVPEDAFEFLARLETLDLSKNQLDKMEERAFAGLASLGELDVSSNAFGAVPSLSFRYLPDLRRLRIGRNPLRDLPTSCFEGLAGLVELSVEECIQLTYVDLNAFSGLSSLRLLRLNGNLNLARFHPMAFERPNVLKELHVADCGLSSLPPELLDWEEVELVELAGNPWDCVCSARWLGQILRRIPIHTQPALCASPRDLQGKELESLMPMECGSGGLESSVVLSLVSVGGALALASLLVGLLFIFRRRITAAFGFSSKPSSQLEGLYAASDTLSSDYDVGRESKKSLLYAYSLGSGGHYVGRSGSLPPPPPFLPSLPHSSPHSSHSPPRDVYATIGDLARPSTNPQFRVIRNYPVPITEL